MKKAEIEEYIGMKIKKEILKDLYCILFLLVPVLILFYDPLFTGKAFYLDDIEATFLPRKYLEKEMFESGNRGLWNPYIYLGTHHNLSIFYPPYLLFLFMKSVGDSLPFYYWMFKTIPFLMPTMSPEGIDSAYYRDSAFLLPGLFILFRGFSNQKPSQENWAKLSMCVGFIECSGARLESKN